MMRRIAARQKIECGIVKRQLLGRRLHRLDVGESLLVRRGGNGRQHVRRQVYGRNYASMRRQQIGDVPASGAEIERAQGPNVADDGLDGLKVGAVRVDGALHISYGARPKLGLDDSLVSSFHGLTPDLFAETACAEISPLQYEYYHSIITFHAGSRSETASRRFHSRPQRARTTRYRRRSPAHTRFAPRGVGGAGRHQLDLVRMD